MQGNQKWGDQSWVRGGSCRQRAEGQIDWQPWRPSAQGPQPRTGLPRRLQDSVRKAQALKAPGNSHLTSLIGRSILPSKPPPPQSPTPASGIPAFQFHRPETRATRFLFLPHPTSHLSANPIGLSFKMCPDHVLLDSI